MVLLKNKALKSLSLLTLKVENHENKEKNPYADNRTHWSYKIGIYTFIFSNSLLYGLFCVIKQIIKTALI